MHLPRPYLWMQRENLQLSQDTNICSKEKVQQTLSRANTCKQPTGAAGKQKDVPLSNLNHSTNGTCPFLGLLAKVHSYSQWHSCSPGRRTVMQLIPLVSAKWKNNKAPSTRVFSWCLQDFFFSTNMVKPVGEAMSSVYCTIQQPQKQR